MAKSTNSAGIQMIGLTTASVFLMSFAFLMYRLDRSAPVETDTRSHIQWRKSYLAPPPKPRDNIGALVARRSAPKPPEPQEPDFDFYRVLPEFSVYVSPDVANQRATVASAPVQTQPQLIATAAVSAAPAPQQQPVIIQQQPVITYSQPVPTTTLIAAKTVPQAAPAPTPAPPTVDPLADVPGEWLQVGAFSQRGDASRRRAEVAMLGLRAHIEPAVIRGSTVFRVKLGPFESGSSRSEASSRLAMAGIDTIVKQR